MSDKPDPLSDVVFGFLVGMALCLILAIGLPIVMVLFFGSR